MIILDLFSGAGGMSEGFWRCGGKFVAHIEMDKIACDTLRVRQAYHELKKQDRLYIYDSFLTKNITKQQLWKEAGIQHCNKIIHSIIDDNTIDDLLKQVEHNMLDLMNDDGSDTLQLDVVIGGPPCQSYSSLGRVNRKEIVKLDSRNYLFKYFIDFLKHFQPKMFVFENVPGMLHASSGEYLQAFKDGLIEAGYHMEYKKLIASDFGVLQARHRVIIIGWNKYHFNRFNYPEFLPDKFDGALVSDLFEDLPKIQSGETLEGRDEYTQPPNDYLIWSKIRDKNFNILTHHEAKLHNDIDKQIYKIAVDTWFNTGKRLKYSDLAKNRPDLATHNSKHNGVFLYRYGVVRSNLEACHTITATMFGNTHIHPCGEQNRSISVREAARIQSFPDDYHFEGTRIKKFRQIGNAVPPLMAEKICNKIQYILDNDQKIVGEIN